MHCIDVKTALLHGKAIERTVFLQPPPEAKIKKLLKCARREFYNRLRSELESLKVVTNSLDQGLFTWKDQEDQGIAICHLDDILFRGDPQFHKKSCFTYIGMNIKQHTDNSIDVNQQLLRNNPTNEV